MVAVAPPPPIAAPERPRYEFWQFNAVRRYMPALAFSPDGSELAYSTNTTGQFNLWRQSTSGGYPHQLTLLTEEAVREIAWSPDGESILFTADHHGDEFTQLYLIPARGGRPQPLTARPGVQYHLGDEPWSPDGRTIAYAGNDRTPTDMDVIVRDVAGTETGRPLTGGYFQPINWSPDGRYLTAVQARSNTDLDLFLVSLDDGAARNLLPHDEEIKLIPGPWAPDGSGFYLLADEGREFLGLAFYELASGSWRWVETPDWDLEGLDLSADGRLLAWVLNEDGSSRLHLRDLHTGRELPTPSLPDGTIGSLTVSRDGAKIAFLLNRPTHPSEIFVLDVASGALTQLTDGFLGGIDETDLIAPELIRFATWDGRLIPAYLYRPPGASAADRVPVVLSIHGGPEAQERPTYGYAGLYQYLLSRGIGVLAPNIRGSSGYGKTYQTLIHRDWSGGDRRDFEAAARYLQGLEWVDPDRLAVCGGSYGGFASLTCASRLPEFWRAAVDIVGPANLVTFTKAVPPQWRRFMAKWIGDPETEADFLLERSPITYVDQITAPLFVIQGAQDPRVVKAESDQIVAKLRERGVEVRYDVYEDEGHGFVKRENEIKALGDVARFLEEHLLT